LPAFARDSETTDPCHPARTLPKVTRVRRAD
jgi:hypothetical protein